MIRYEVILIFFQLVLRNSLDPDPDWDFWLDPDSMNMDPKHCSLPLLGKSTWGQSELNMPRFLKILKIDDGSFQR